MRVTQAHAEAGAIVGHLWTGMDPNGSNLRQQNHKVVKELKAMELSSHILFTVCL